MSDAQYGAIVMPQPVAFDFHTPRIAALEEEARRKDADKRREEQRIAGLEDKRSDEEKRVENDRFRLTDIPNDETRAEMKRILEDIQSGKFVKDWMLENRVNQTSFKAMRAKMAAHPLEQVGEKLRAMMPWIKQRALVDRSKN